MLPVHGARAPEHAVADSPPRGRLDAGAHRAHCGLDAIVEMQLFQDVRLDEDLSGGGIAAATEIASAGPAIAVVMLLRASASDTDGTITKVGFYDGTKLIGEDTTSGGGSWQTFGPRGDGLNRDYGSHALYDVGKILVAGGDHSSNTALMIDINGATPRVTPTAASAGGECAPGASACTPCSSASVAAPNSVPGCSPPRRLLTRASQS
jgi:hypothetical protein